MHVDKSSKSIDKLEKERGSEVKSTDRERRFRPRVWLVGALGLMLLAFPAGALASVNPPSISSSFTPNSIGVGDTSALAYAITNPNTSGLTGIGFTDDLPSGVTVDNPNGVSVGKSCGAGATLTANPGDSTISLTGASLAPARSDTATVSSGSDTVTDPSITATDQGALVSGTGIPPLTYVGTVTAGTSFLLSSSPTVQNDVAATDNGTSVTIEPTCVVSAAVTAATAGTYTNNTGTVTSTEGGSGNSDTESLTVIGPPTVTITSPANGATFTYGQRVLAHYSCHEATNPDGPGLGYCGGDVNNGSPIHTTTPGRNTFTVTAISNDGEVTNQTVDYTVLPNNSFSVSHLTAESNGHVIFDAALPGAGKLVSVEHAVVKGQTGSRVLFGSGSLSVSRRGSDGVAVPLTAQGKQLVKQVHAANHGKHPKHEVIDVTLSVTYTPKGGRAKTLTFSGIVVKP